MIGPVEPPRTRARELKFLLIGLLVLAAVAVALVVRGLVVTTTASNGQQTSAVSRAAVLARASAVTKQAVGYTPGTFDSDAAKAATGMTSAMAQKYRALTDQVRSDVIARGRSEKTDLTAAAMISLTSTSARVLEFLVQTSTISGATTQQVDARRLLVTLKKEHGVWLIDSMDPF